MRTVPWRLGVSFVLGLLASGRGSGGIRLISRAIGMPYADVDCEISETLVHDSDSVKTVTVEESASCRHTGAAEYEAGQDYVAIRDVIKMEMLPKFAPRSPREFKAQMHLRQKKEKRKVAQASNYCRARKRHHRIDKQKLLSTVARIECKILKHKVRKSVQREFRLAA